MIIRTWKARAPVELESDSSIRFDRLLCHTSKHSTAIGARGSHDGKTRKALKF
jgi:hypothetical protein